MYNQPRQYQQPGTLQPIQQPRTYSQPKRYNPQLLPMYGSRQQPQTPRLNRNLMSRENVDVNRSNLRRKVQPSLTTISPGQYQYLTPNNNVKTFYGTKAGKPIPNNIAATNPDYVYELLGLSKPDPNVPAPGTLGAAVSNSNPFELNQKINEAMLNAPGYRPYNAGDPMLNYMVNGFAGLDSGTDPNPWTHIDPFGNKSTFQNGYWANTPQNTAQAPKYDFAGNPLGANGQVLTKPGNNPTNPIQGSSFTPDPYAAKVLLGLSTTPTVQEPQNLTEAVRAGGQVLQDYLNKKKGLQ